MCYKKEVKSVTFIINLNSINYLEGKLWEYLMDCLKGKEGTEDEEKWYQKILDFFRGLFVKK